MCVILLPTFNPYGIVLITVGLKLLINIGEIYWKRITQYTILNTHYFLNPFGFLIFFPLLFPNPS